MSAESKKLAQFRAALTHAKNSGNPQRVISAVEEFERYYSKNGPIPDQWSNWQRAADDAQYQINRQFFRPIFE